MQEAETRPQGRRPGSGTPLRSPRCLQAPSPAEPSTAAAPTPSPALATTCSDHVIPTWASGQAATPLGADGGHGPSARLPPRRPVTRCPARTPADAHEPRGARTNPHVIPAGAGAPPTAAGMRAGALAQLSDRRGGPASCAPGWAGPGRTPLAARGDRPLRPCPAGRRATRWVEGLGSQVSSECYVPTYSAPRPPRGVPGLGARAHPDL